ncbi:hypothetical protein LIA77_09101 [Sarocladium implicatum]|nr:hypothetical protein LIA77_09101 [Sarocladium implicatum]
MSHSGVFRVGGSKATERAVLIALLSLIPKHAATGDSAVCQSGYRAAQHPSTRPREQSLGALVMAAATTETYHVFDKILRVFRSQRPETCQQPIAEHESRTYATNNLRYYLLNGSPL